MLTLWVNGTGVLHKHRRAKVNPLAERRFAWSGACSSNARVTARLIPKMEPNASPVTPVTALSLTVP